MEGEALTYIRDIFGVARFSGRDHPIANRITRQVVVIVTFLLVPLYRPAWVIEDQIRGSDGDVGVDERATSHAVRPEDGGSVAPAEQAHGPFPPQSGQIVQAIFVPTSPKAASNDVDDPLEGILGRPILYRLILFVGEEVVRPHLLVLNGPDRSRPPRPSLEHQDVLLDLVWLLLAPFLELVRQRERGHHAAKAGADYCHSVVLTIVHLRSLLYGERMRSSPLPQQPDCFQRRGPWLCIPSRRGCPS